MFVLLLNVYVNMNVLAENGCKYNMKYKQLQELKDFLSFINILIAFCFYSVMIIFNANYHELIKKFFDLRLEMMFTIYSNMMTKKGVP